MYCRSCRRFSGHVNDRTSSMDLLGLRHTAKITQRRQARVVRGQSARDVVVGRFGQMAGDLLVEIALVPSRTHKGGHAPEQRAERLHDGSSTILKKRSMMPVVRCHCASSLSSCLRPARVSE